MSIEESFQELINRRGIYKQLGETPAGIKMLRKRIDKVSLDKKIELLKRDGYEIEIIVTKK